MRPTTVWLHRATRVFFGSMLSAAAFCIGCSVHESNRWGQSQDGITHILAAGTYLSLLAMLASIATFVFTLFVRLLKRT